MSNICLLLEDLIHMYIYIYIYIHLNSDIYIYIYIYITINRKKNEISKGTLNSIVWGVCDTPLLL